MHQLIQTVPENTPNEFFQPKISLCPIKGIVTLPSAFISSHYALAILQTQLGLVRLMIEWNFCLLSTTWDINTPTRYSSNRIGHVTYSILVIVMSFPSLSTLLVGPSITDAKRRTSTPTANTWLEHETYVDHSFDHVFGLLASPLHDGLSLHYIIFHFFLSFPMFFSVPTSPSTFPICIMSPI